MARLIMYECDECGCEVTVKEMSESQLSPLYCCGEEMETAAAGKKAKPKKKAAKKKTAGKKKPAAKKKTKRK